MSQDEIDPYYTDGVSGVEHRNVDASGENHPFGDTPKEWEADLRPLIRQIADDLYDSWESTIREYLANSETACLKVTRHLQNPEDSPFDSLTVPDDYKPRITVTWDRSKQKLIIQDNGIGMAAAEVDKVFRHIGRSAARDIGVLSGAFGMGALSFPKFIGDGNSTMIMLSNSRLNEDNAAYLVSLAGIEPIRGSLENKEYGTKFKLDQKKEDMDVRQAVKRFAQWMRVPVLYKEHDENGNEVFNEDWGDKRLFDSYDKSTYVESFVKPECFEAYSSEEANGVTLLLSMEIDRNASFSTRDTYPIDIRLLDESGKVVESSNGNEGLIPISRPEYNQMLIDERTDHIIEGLLSNKDVTAFETAGKTYDYAIEEAKLESDMALPVAEYVPLSEGDGRLLADKVVIIGPHQGRTVVSEHEWNELKSGRAAQFVPKDELEQYDLKSGEGDLCLPKPSTDRSSLQENDTFWKYLSKYFDDAFDGAIERYRRLLRESNDTMSAIREMNPKTVDQINVE